MAILSELMIFNQTRLHELQNVRKLNCSNFQLVDVSILKKMPNVQFLYLTMNKINSLSDFAHCTSLEELYLKRNKINDINEIFYLTKLSKLKKLWLAENPCAETSNYRYTVLKAIPQLQVLDCYKVFEEEVKKAKKLGSVIYDPETGNPFDYSHLNNSNNESETYSKGTNSEEHFSYNYSNNYGYKNDDQLNTNSEINQNELSSKSNTSANFYKKNYSNDIKENYTVNHGNSDDHNSYSSNYKNEEHLNLESNQNESTSKQNTSSNLCERNSISETSENYCSNEINLHNNVPTNCSNNSTYSNNRIFKHSKTMLSKGGKNRNSNILSAVLCLLKELDLASLEVVETQVHCRMEELDD